MGPDEAPAFPDVRRPASSGSASPGPLSVSPRSSSPTNDRQPRQPHHHRGDGDDRPDGQALQRGPSSSSPTTGISPGTPTGLSGWWTGRSSTTIRTSRLSRRRSLRNPGKPPGSKRYTLRPNERNQTRCTGEKDGFIPVWGGRHCPFDAAGGVCAAVMRAGASESSDDTDSDIGGYNTSIAFGCAQ